MSLWTWDANHFTLDDDANHTFDGWHIDVWTWDADHFTLDDNLNHTFDGWHDDTAIIVPDLDITSGGEDPEHKRRRYELIAAHREEPLLMMIVKSYVKQVF